MPIKILTDVIRVAVLYSGGKDSTFALYYALQQGWDVAALIAVKPKDTEAYLYHYATVEWTLLSSEAMGIPIVLLKTDKNGPLKEAKELEKVFKRIKVDAVLLGGVGLQKTQIESVAKVAKKYNINVIVPHQNSDHYELFKQVIQAGFDIRITQVATDGLGPEWLGKRIGLTELKELKRLSEKYGFHIGFEGGYADTFVCDGPIFKKRIEFVDIEKKWDKKTSSGYLQVNNAILLDK